MPTDEALRRHYQDPTYFEGEDSQGYRNYADIRKALAPHFRRRLDRIRNALPNGRSILDFGCAAGYFLEIAKARGWKIAGVELSEEMAKQASSLLGIGVAQTLQESMATDLDAITLWEVIEHMPRPVEQLSLLRERLQRGGALMLSTPNNGHWQALREPDQWRVYCPPSHLIYFDRETLKHALHQAGFDRIEVRGVMPLPPLPNWVRRRSESLQMSLANGNAKNWRTALVAWRAIRVFGFAWQKFVRANDDIYTTLEAIAFQPAASIHRSS
jgi:2-polyprenyl-3-methyl-5-hydroxy-6-metoxy-1,4-benzoquinol methylase